MTSAGPSDDLQDDLLAAAKEAREGLIALARKDAAVFCEYVLKDEETKADVENAPHHWVWQRILDAHPSVVIFAHIESAKTSAISLGRTLWETGNDPTLRHAIASANQDQAKKVLRAVRTYIESSDELREVFPDLLPSEPWTDTAITVHRKTFSRDPTVQVCGASGTVIGSRLDRITLDDILKWSNCNTPHKRLEMVAWYNATFGGRLVQRGRFRAVGVPWYEDDLLEVLAKRPGTKAFRFPVQKADGSSNWPARWPMERIADLRLNMLPREVARQLDVRPLKTGSSRVDEAWITRCVRNGDGITLLDRIDPEQLPPGAFVTHGVDIASSKRKKRLGGKSTILSVLHYPDGMRQLVGAQGGNWKAPEFRDRLVRTHELLGGSIFVEDVGVQGFLIEILDERAHHVPVYPFTTTGAAKWDPNHGVESIINEFQRGRWIIPNVGGSTAPVVAEVLQDVRDFDPAEHTGDYLMGLWFAKEGGRLFERLRAADDRLNESAASPVIEAAPEPAPPEEEVELTAAERRRRDRWTRIP